MSTKSKIAIVLFVLQIISTAGIVIGTSKDYLGALASAIGLSVLMIIAAVLVLVDNKKMYDKIKNSKSDFFVDETIKQTEQESEIEEDDTISKEEIVQIIGVIVTLIVVITVLLVCLL